MTERSGPLRGLTVVDLSTTLASAFTSLIFADFGAEVLQIEPPGGSRLRTQASWPFWLRGKKSVALDFHQAADLEVARSLAGDADVVIEAFRPGVAARLELGDDDLRPDNPGLVYTSISGFGATGPYARLKAYEAVVMAKTGSMYGPNRSGRPGPVLLKPLGATFAGALLAAQGSLLALHERVHSGHGQRVDATLIQGMLAQDPWTYFAKVLARLFPDAFSGVGQAPAPGRPVPTTWLGFGLLTGYSADGRWMQFAHATPRQFEAFVQELGLGWARTDGQWRDAPDSADEVVRERWWEMMLEAVRSKTTADWQEVFDRNGDTFAEVFRQPTELFGHPQIVHDDHTVEVEVEGLGHVRQMGPLVKMTVTPGSGGGQPPELDEHGAELRARRRRDRAPVSGPAGQRPALEGIVVVDLGTFYAGPFGSTMLTDHGARVIKIEPLEGDPIRYQMPVPEWAGVRVTQGKESLAVDAFSEEGHAIVVELIKRADVVLHSYRGGVAKRMGLDADSMLALNPNLVYHHAQGYGIDGPYARRAAYAPTIAAGSGFARRSGGGGPEGVPLTLEQIKDQTAFLAGAPSGHPDGFAALGVGLALALGLVARDLGHGGQSTLTSMLSTMGHVLSDTLVGYEGVCAPPEPDRELYGYSALYRLYESSDGWVVLCVTNEREWQGLAGALHDQVDLAGDRRFATAEQRTANDAALAGVLSKVFASGPSRAWEDSLSAVDVACAEVLPNLGGLCSGLMDAGGVADQLGMTTMVEHPIFGQHPRSTALVTLSRSGQTLRPGCLVGQHTDAILRELGYPDERIAELRAAKIVGG